MALVVILAVTCWTSQAAPQSFALHVPQTRDPLSSIPPLDFEADPPSEEVHVSSTRGPTRSSPIPPSEEKTEPPSEEVQVPSTRRPAFSRSILAKDSEKDINFATLYSSLSKLNVVDIRSPDELELFGMIPGTKNLPLQELNAALDLTAEAFQAKYGFPKLSPDDDTLVLTCRSGRRVRMADQILKSRGFTKHRIYYGSFLDWVMKGGPVVKP